MHIACKWEYKLQFSDPHFSWSSVRNSNSSSSVLYKQMHAESSDFLY